MACTLNAVIADLEPLRATGLAVVPLPQGKGLVPLTDEFWDGGRSALCGGRRRGAMMHPDRGRLTAARTLAGSAAAAVQCRPESD